MPSPEPRPSRAALARFSQRVGKKSQRHVHLLPTRGWLELILVDSERMAGYFLWCTSTNRLALGYFSKFHSWVFNYYTVWILKNVKKFPEFFQKFLKYTVNLEVRKNWPSIEKIARQSKWWRMVRLAVRMLSLQQVFSHLWCLDMCLH